MIESGNPRDMIMGAENAEGDAIDSYSQSKVQWGEARMTMQMDINRPLTHLKRVRGDLEDFSESVRKELGGVGHVPGLPRK